jgi:hypothetical protein
MNLISGYRALPEHAPRISDFCTLNKLPALARLDGTITKMFKGAPVNSGVHAARQIVDALSMLQTYWTVGNLIPEVLEYFQEYRQGALDKIVPRWI